MTRSVSNDPSAFVKPKKWHNVQLSKPPNKDSLYKLNSPFLTHSPKLSSDVDRVVPKLVFEHTQTTGTYSNFDQKCLLPIGFGQNQVTENRTKESIITVPTQNDANYNEAVMKNIETVNSIPPHSTELISNNISTVEINTDKGPIENINSVDLEKTVKLASPNVIPEVVPAELPDLFEPLYNDLSSDLAIHQAQENFILALCYIQQYSELSPDQASYVCELFEDAAKVGHIDAAFNAGLCYDPLGAFNHIANDISRAIVFYKQAAFEGHKRAQYRLGLLLLEKVSDAKQRVYFEEGIKWIKKSAEGHFKEAQELVKFFQLKGILV
ncbi:hypothetical protein BC833DRAFT_604076 [Globomyces pollinis-pini]|nr:hypothetical protein BC833DRAFT_604076 [Globomyces pollinis-pini]